MFYRVFATQNKHMKYILHNFMHIKMDEIYQLIDCYYKDGKIVIYTRLGRSNNDEHKKMINTLVYYGIKNSIRFNSMVHDKLDNTYIYFYYDVLDKDAVSALKEIEKDQGDTSTVGEKCQKHVDSFKNMDYKQRENEIKKLNSEMTVVGFNRDDGTIEESSFTDLFKTIGNK